MKQFLPKLKLIFVPYLVIAVSFAAVYTFFHWYLLIKHQAFIITDDYVYFAPGVLIWVPLLIWLRPRLKLMKWNFKGKRDPVFLMLLLAWLAIGLPTVLLQMFLVTSTGKLTKLHYITEIKSAPATKYYKIDDFHVDKSRAMGKTIFSTSGKGNRTLDMTIYIVVPIVENEPAPPKRPMMIDTAKLSEAFKLRNGRIPILVLNNKVITKEKLFTANPQDVDDITVLKPKAAIALYGAIAKYGAIIIKTKPLPQSNRPGVFNKEDAKPLAWLGVKYHEAVSNSLSSAEKDSAYNNFSKRSDQEFNTSDLHTFIYLDKIGMSNDLEGYCAAIDTGKLDPQNIPVILIPVNEPFELRNGSKIKWAGGIFGIGSLIFLLGLQFVPLRPQALNESKRLTRRRTSTTWKDANILIPHEKFFITPIIINVNILVFIIMCSFGLGFMEFNAADLLKWGGNLRYRVLEGQYWRLLTSTFLHGGIMHLLFNMYGLLSVGVFLEPVLGRWRYSMSYLTTGVCASLVSITWHHTTVSVGASGAIFGLYGIFLALLTTNFFPKDFKRVFLINSVIFIGYNLLAGLTGNIDNAAHIGGLITGIVIGYLLYPYLKSKQRAEASINKIAEQG